MFFIKKKSYKSKKLPQPSKSNVSSHSGRYIPVKVRDNSKIIHLLHPTHKSPSKNNYVLHAKTDAGVPIQFFYSYGKPVASIADNGGLRVYSKHGRLTPTTQKYLEVFLNQNNITPEQFVKDATIL